MIKRKKFSALLAIMFAASSFFMSGCGKNADTTSSANKQTTQKEEKKVSKIKDNYEIKKTPKYFSDGIGCIELIKKDDSGSEKKQYGFIDENFKWIIQPQDFAEVREFKEGLCAAKDKEKDLWGYINTKGEWAIKPQFQKIADFSSGVAIVEGSVVDDFTKKSNDETFVIDKEGNKKFKLDIPFFHSDKHMFKSKYYFYETDYKTFDLNGEMHNTGKCLKTIVGKNVKNIDRFARFVKNSQEGKHVLVTTNGIIFLADIDGNIIKKFDDSFPHYGIKDGKFTLTISGGYAYFDVKGNLLLKSQPLEDSKKIHTDLDFHEGLASFRIYKDSQNPTDSYGFINEKGEVITKLQYTGVTDFSNGYAFACEMRKNGQSGYWTVIDKAGNVVVDSSKMIVNIENPSNGYKGNVFMVKVRKDKDKSIDETEDYLINTKTQKMIKIDDLISTL